LKDLKKLLKYQFS